MLIGRSVGAGVSVIVAVSVAVGGTRVLVAGGAGVAVVLAIGVLVGVPVGVGVTENSLVLVGVVVVAGLLTVGVGAGPYFRRLGYSVSEALVKKSAKSGLRSIRLLTAPIICPKVANSDLMEPGGGVGVGVGTGVASDRGVLVSDAPSLEGDG